MKITKEKYPFDLEINIWLKNIIHNRQKLYSGMSIYDMSLNQKYSITNKY